MEQVRWRKSRRSVGNPEQCVELAQLRNAVGVRDSKNPKTELHFSPSSFGAFLRSFERAE
ncbi:DUF397 domain-containing protein [Actinosynnema sp. NPDC050801]|uniref:DUF397 domain-containing protein n=1 Tax=unclassified Actinosynnema TaxID=2637065 RepID=UPI0033CF9084